MRYKCFLLLYSVAWSHFIEKIYHRSKRSTYALSDVTASMTTECAVKCTTLVGCDSFDYNYITGQCQLLGHTGKENYSDNVGSNTWEVQSKLSVNN